MVAPDPVRVVVVGGGFAAIELVLALRALAPEEVAVTVVSEDADFLYRPEAVEAPFGRAPRRYRLSAIARAIGFELVEGQVVAVRTDARAITLASGRELAYDELVVACGALTEPAVDHATTVLAPQADDLHWIVRELEEGTVEDVVLVAGEHAGWTLPIYEIALRLAARAASMDAEARITIATHETQPLEILGGPAADAVAAALMAAEIEVLPGCREFHRRPHGLVTYPDGRTLRADRVVALPELRGPGIDGLPTDERGFICAGPAFGVPGEPLVHVIGDAAAYPVKQGGLATQQADTVAAGIVARAGGAGAPRRPFERILRATLTTGDEPLYLSGEVVDGRVPGAQVTRREPVWGRQKVVGERLSPFLEDLDRHGLDEAAARLGADRSASSG